MTTFKYIPDLQGVQFARLQDRDELVRKFGSERIFILSGEDKGYRTGYEDGLSEAIRIVNEHYDKKKSNTARDLMTEQYVEATIDYLDSLTPPPQ